MTRQEYVLQQSLTMREIYTMVWNSQRRIKEGRAFKGDFRVWYVKPKSTNWDLLDTVRL